MMVVSRPVSTKPAGPTLPLLWRASILDSLKLALSRLSDSKTPPARRIRKSRQATKVARALLRLAPRGLKRQALGARMALASVARRLSGVRDADSLKETLMLVAAEARLDKAALTALARPLTRNRSRLDSHEARTLAEAREILGKMIRQIEEWKLPAGGTASILAAARDDYRRLRRDGAGLGPDVEIERLHEARKRAILHRHQWAFFATLALRPEAAARLTARALKLKEMHQALGQHRDLALLDDYLRPLANPKLHGAIESLLETIHAMQDKLARQAGKSARRLIRRKPGAMMARLATALKLNQPERR